MDRGLAQNSKGRQGRSMAASDAPLTDDEIKILQFEPFCGQAPPHSDYGGQVYAWLREPRIGAECVVGYARGHFNLLDKVLMEYAHPFDVEILRSEMK